MKTPEFLNKVFRVLIQLPSIFKRSRYLDVLAVLIVLAIIGMLFGCNATHRVYIGAGMLSDRTSTLTPYVMYDREGKDDWHFQIGYHEYAQLSLIKHFGSGHIRAYFGLSYIPGGLPRDVQCSQGNARSGLSAEIKQFSIAAWHDSNMRVCKPNTGFNFITAGYRFE